MVSRFAFVGSRSAHPNIATQMDTLVVAPRIDRALSDLRFSDADGDLEWSSDEVSHRRFGHDLQHGRRAAQ